MSRSRGLTTAAIAGAIGLVVTALVLCPDDSAGPCVVETRAVRAELPEASGLAISRRHPGIVWAHNDSGNAAVLFALDPAGAVRGRVRVPVVTRDWEDVSAGRCPAGTCLYVGDIGDNRLARSQIRIYRIPEPDPQDGETAPPDLFTATYADGRHNAEALFVVGEDLFVITRDRVGGVYRSRGSLAAGRELTLERIGELALAAVSDAEATPDERLIVVRTSAAALVYRTADMLRGGAVTPALTIPIGGLGEPQGEGVALDAGGQLYLASEGWSWNPAGRLVRLRCTLPER